ncbi:hypothetical protein ACJZ2D_010313 [Fusarium nematophilum]
MQDLAIVYLPSFHRRIDYYVNVKRRMIAEDSLPISCYKVQTSAEEFERTIEDLNDDSKVAGISILLPLPPTLDPSHLSSKIVRQKEVEGFSDGCGPNIIAGAVVHYLLETGLSAFSPELVIQRLGNFYSAECVRTLRVYGYNVHVMDGVSGTDNDSLDSQELQYKDEIFDLGEKSRGIFEFVRQAVGDYILEVAKKGLRGEQKSVLRLGLVEQEQGDTAPLLPACRFVIDMWSDSTTLHDRGVLPGLPILTWAARKTLDNCCQSASAS